MTPSGDPYRNFRFRVTWTGRPVAGFSEISVLPQETERTGYRKTGSPFPSIGPEGQGCLFISLERGITFDLGFERWISMVRCYGPATGKGSLLREYKRPLTIEECDENGKAEYAYHLFRCWVAEYTAAPGPDAGANEIVIKHLKLGFESWERDPPEQTISQNT